MDRDNRPSYEEEYASAEEEPRQRPRELPLDLPKSLDDRRAPSSYGETEIWDGWQGIEGSKLGHCNVLMLCRQAKLNISRIRPRHR